MPRDVSFKVDVVLADAMQLFWRKGYQATSMRDLTEVTQLHPGSFYYSFGNKKAFFLAVTDYYYKELTANINKQLAGTSNSVELLRDFFAKVVISSDSTSIRGCLLVNTMLEMTQDSDIQTHIAAMFTGLEEMFYWILVSGQKNRQISTELDCREQAQLLVNDYFGLRVQSMTEKTETELKKLIELRIKYLVEY